MFTGVSPKEIACCACTFGVETHASHLYAQSRFFVCADTIQVSAQPVAPSFGIRSFDRRLRRLQRVRLVRPRGADHRVAVLEQVDLVGGERPVLLDQRLLLLEQVDRRVELGLVELVGVPDAELGFVFIR